MESGDQFAAIVLGLAFSAGTVITISILWLVFRGRMKALDVLRAYAERGEEPPASVIEALSNVSGRTHPATAAPATPQTRGTHLAYAATNAVLAAGLAGLAWWRISAFGDTSPGIGLSLLVALFFTAGLATRLVRAYYAPADKR
jgi:hypothetical protein